MKKTIPILLCVILLVGIVMAVPALATEEETTQQTHSHCICGGAAENVADHVCQDDVTWTGVQTAADIPVSGGNCYLMNDVTVTNTMAIKNGQTLNICLNGNKLTIDNTANRIFTVENGTVNICDCSYDAQTDRFAGSVVAMRTGYWAAVANVAGSNAKLYVYGGNFSNGSENGTNLFYINSTGTMYLYNGHITGGSIASNTNASVESGGIWVNAGKLFMHGGTITGGYGQNAGGVSLHNASTMVMTGGSITGNTAKNENRGDIFVSGSGTCNITMSGDCQVGWICLGTGKKIQVAAAGMGSNASVGVFLLSGDYPNNPVASGTDVDALAFTNVSAGTNYTLAAEYGNNVYFCQPTSHVHCVCNGAAADGRGGHVCGRKWFFTLQDTATELPTFGNYFLAGDVTLTKATTVNAGGSLSLCLNGHDLSTSATAVFGSCRRTTLNVCDHKTEGEYAGSVCSSTAASTSGSIIQTMARFNLNIYGGNWVNNTTGARAIRVTCNSPYENPDTGVTSSDDPYNASVLSMYDGTISGGNAPYAGGNVALINAAVMNMYGGTVTGGKGTTGGNICLSNTATTFNGFGGEVKDGTGTNGGNICGLTGATINLRGTAVSNGTGSGNGGNVYSEGTLQVNGSTITGGTASNGGGIYSKGTATIKNVTITGGTVINNGGNVANYGTMTLTDSRLENGTAINNTENNGLGGNLHAGAASTTTISGCTFSGGNGNQGGNLSGWGKMDVTDSVIEDGTARIAGGNVLVYSATADVTLEDVTVINGTVVPDETEDEPVDVNEKATAIRIYANGKLTLKDVCINGTDGATIQGKGILVLEGTVEMPCDNFDLCLYVSDVNYIDVSKLTSTGETPLAVRLRTDDSEGDEAGTLAINATAEQAALFTSWNTAYYVSYADNALQLTPYAIQARNSKGALTGYTSWEAAMADTTEGITYYMLTADVAGGTIAKEILLDLAGNSLTGVTIPAGVTVYGMDSATDDYDITDGYGVLSLAADSQGTVASMVKTDKETVGAVKRYLTVAAEDGTLSFHRFFLGITKMSLKPGVTGVGYKAQFYGDELVLGQVKSYGYNLWIGDGEKLNAGKTGAFTSGKEVTLRLQNFDVANYGTAAINAEVYLELADGTVVTSAAYSYTLKGMLESIAKDVSGYTDTQMSALQTMCKNNADAMADWQIDSILNWTATEEA